MNLGDYVKTKIAVFLSKIDFNVLDLFDPEMESMDMKLSFYMISTIDENVVIPVGTKESPKGLAASDKKLVIIYNKEDPDYIIVTREEVIGYLRDQAADTERKVGDDWKTICIVTPWASIKSYFAECPI